MDAEEAVAGDEGGGEMVGGEPSEQIPATFIEAGVFGGGFFVAMEDGLGLAAAGIIQLRERFENRPGTDGHFGFNEGEIEDRRGEGAVHVEEDGAGKNETSGGTGHQNHGPRV